MNECESTYRKLLHGTNLCHSTRGIDPRLNDSSFMYIILQCFMTGVKFYHIVTGTVLRCVQWCTIVYRLICECVVSGGQYTCSPLMFMQVNCYGFSHSLHSTNSNLAPIKTWHWMKECMSVMSMYVNKRRPHYQVQYIPVTCKFIVNGNLCANGVCRNCLCTWLWLSGTAMLFTSILSILCRDERKRV